MLWLPEIGTVPAPPCPPRSVLCSGGHSSQPCVAESGQQLFLRSGFCIVSSVCQKQDSSWSAQHADHRLGVGQTRLRAAVRGPALMPLSPSLSLLDLNLVLTSSAWHQLAFSSEPSCLSMSFLLLLMNLLSSDLSSCYSHKKPHVSACVINMLLLRA